MAFANIPNRSVIITEGDLALNPLNYRQLCASFPLMRGALSYMPHAPSTRRAAHRMRDRSSARHAACERAAERRQDNNTRQAAWHGRHSSNVRGRTAARLWLNVAVCWNMEPQTARNMQQTTRNRQHATTNVQQATRNTQQTTDSMQPTTRNMQQITRITQQATDSTQRTPRRRAAGRGAKACAAT
jgi:hypothetical protein